MASVFPHSTSTGPAPTANEIYFSYRQAYKQQFYDGVLRPVVFPCNYLGIFTLIIYMCIPHKKSPIIYASRLPLVGLITWFELRLILETSGVGMSIGYISGLCSALTIMLSWTWLVFKRPQWDAKRVERRRVRVGKDTTKSIPTEKSSSNGSSNQEKLVHGAVQFPEKSCYKLLENGEMAYEYFWQPYPDDLKERISWVLDLILNARGPGWNWAIHNIPKLTPEVQSRLGGLAPDRKHPKISPLGQKRFVARYEHFLSQIIFSFKCFLIADVLRVIMMKDPYFKFGPTAYELPPYLKPLHPSLLQFYRLLLSACGVIAGLSMGFSNIDIFLSCILGPRVLGLRGESWYYQDVLGKFSHIFDKGLNGLWGNYWHQTFRLFFTAPTKYLIQEGYIKAGNYSTKIIGLFFAFSLSGFLHWAGSMTSFGSTSPIQEATFFIFQGIGIVFQQFLCHLLSSLILKSPRFLRQTGNLLYTLTWLYLTGWLAADDFARVGFWLVEPLPFSPMQALGFGEYDTGWNCIKYFDLSWFTGKYFWESGITLL
ncbi:hypothetical protein HI914_04851 [Erysiphe necator]|nr:hypothetical protein HI914_04851 [Erysiphe necator]